MDSRNNIMFRKPKAYGGRNDSTAETQYAAEQARLQALRQKREELTESKRISNCGSSDERYNSKSQTYQDAQYQLEVRQQLMRDEHEKKQRADQEMEDHRRKVLDMEQQREMERRAKMRQIQEENRIAAMSKNYNNVYQKINEDRRDRDAIESNLYNYNPNVL